MCGEKKEAHIGLSVNLFELVFICFALSMSKQWQSIEKKIRLLIFVERIDLDDECKKLHNYISITTKKKQQISWVQCESVYNRSV